MSEASSISGDNHDDKDEDFKVDDCRNEIDSDDSYCDIPDINTEKNTSGANQQEMEEQPEHEYIGPVLPGGHRFDRKFVCIKYPGNVVNPDKAIETLGGIGSISTAIDTPNRRLELRFRPDDVYCKPACGDRHKTVGFLLRVRVKKSKAEKAREAEAKQQKAEFIDFANLSISETDKDNANAVSSSGRDDSSHTVDKDQERINELANRVENCSVGTADVSDDASKNLPSASGKNSQDSDKSSSETKKNTLPTFDRNKYEDLAKDDGYELPELKVLGQVDTEFKFKNLCDFQYLPMTQNQTDSKKLECIYDMIYPVNIPHYSWLKNKVPYFLPPAAFSRMDTVQQYIPKTEVESHPENVIGKNKKRKAGFTNFIYFSTPEVPTKPPAGIETAMKVKFVQSKHYEQMRQIFEERPIWSKNALMYKTQLSSDRLKILLPSVAYYFMTGPWKIMWVKLGYDPRKDISARKYQTLDYRLKAMHGLGFTVKCKRNYSHYTLPYKSAPVSKQKTAILSSALGQQQSQKKQQDRNENVYIYREGMVPPSRQMFYQYCDVLVDEIQEMLAKLPEPLPGARCQEKRGWLPVGFDVQCREIINKQVRAVLRKRMNIPEDHPTSLPRKRKRGMAVKRGELKQKKKKKVESNDSESKLADLQETDEVYDLDEPRPSTSKANL